MKFLIIGDLHGVMPKIKFEDFDAIIAPGDFCSDAPRKLMFQALKENLANPDSKTDWFDIVGKAKAKEMIEQSLADGRKVLEFLNSLNKPVYITPGNWDWTLEESEGKDWDFLKQDHYQKLISKLDNINDLNLISQDIGDYIMIGHGISSGPEYPQYEEDLKRYSEEELKEKKKKYEEKKKELAELFANADKPVIFVSHNVPFNTEVDKINNKDSPRDGQHFGSLISRELIDQFQPLVCIGGHMHEHFKDCQLDKTKVINAGFGAEVNVLLELEGNKIKELTFKKD